MAEWPSDAELDALDADFRAAEAEADTDAPDRDLDHDDDGERYGFGVCARGTCIEPCGPNGGCIAGARRRGRSEP